MRIWKLSAGFAVLLIVSLPAGAQTRYGGRPQGTTVEIAGTSTAHDWEMKGTLIGGYAEFAPDVKLDAAAASIPGLNGDKVPVKVHAIIPVQAMHSEAKTLPDVMDHLMQEHMKADQFPRIEYTLTEMTFKGPHTANTPFNLDTTGDLSMAGVTNKVSFPVTLEVVDEHTIKIHAVVPLKMTAFGVDPPAPKLGFGTLKCGDDIKITIDWTLMKKG